MCVLIGLGVARGPTFEISLSFPQWGHWLTGWLGLFLPEAWLLHVGATKPSLPPSRGLPEQTHFLPFVPWTHPTFKGCLSIELPEHLGPLIPSDPGREESRAWAGLWWLQGDQIAAGVAGCKSLGNKDSGQPVGV